MQSRFSAPAQAAATMATMDLIAGFRADFPEYKDKIFFKTGVDKPGEPGTPEAIANHLAASTFGHSKYATPETQVVQGYRQFVKEMADEPKAHGVTGSDFRVITGFNEKGLSAGGLATLQTLQMAGGSLGEAIAVKAMVGFGKKQDQYDTAYVFDHETGHGVTKKFANQGVESAAYQRQGVGNTYDEMRADAYATIMHVKRFGNETGYPEFVRDMRARTMLQADGVPHYTSEAIQEVIKMRDRGLLDEVKTAKQAASLAVVVANKHNIPHLEGAKISNAMESTGNIDGYDQTAAQQLAAIKARSQQAGIPIMTRATEMVAAAAERTQPGITKFTTPAATAPVKPEQPEAQQPTIAQKPKAKGLTM